MSSKSNGKQLVTSEAQLESLSQRAQSGDARAMGQLHRALSAVRSDWENEFTSAVESVRHKMLEASVGNNLLIREAWLCKTAAWQRDLEGVSPTPLERILCERAATCWLEQQLVDISYYGRLEQGMTFANSSHFQRRQDRAHKRYLSACLVLARARRLLKPVMQQVNIARPGSQQLNVAAPGVLPTPAAAIAAAPAGRFAFAEVIESMKGREQ